MTLRAIGATADYKVEGARSNAEIDVSSIANIKISERPTRSIPSIQNKTSTLLPLSGHGIRLSSHKYFLCCRRPGSPHHSAVEELLHRLKHW